MKVLLAALALLLPLTAAPTKALSLVGVQYHEYTDGPTLPRNYHFLAGETVFLSFEIAGYTPVENKLDLAYTISITDPAGHPLMETKSNTIKAELAHEDKGWNPKVRADIPIVGSAPTGTYQILVQLQDNLAKSNYEEKISFLVKGKEIEPSDKLVIRNFGFLRHEEDEKALPQPSYRPGDSIYARFDVVGFQSAEHNRLDIKYGAKLTNSKGDVLLDVDNAALDTVQSFYPKRFVPASFSVELKKDVPPGEYTLTLRVRDDIGKQSIEVPEIFQIEQ